jgi:UDP-glucose 4-epimerase
VRRSGPATLRERIRVQLDELALSELPALPVGSRAAGDASHGPKACMSTRPVLVTGGAGFIGSNLVRRLLEDGHRVVAVDDLSSTGAREPVRGALRALRRALHLRARDIRRGGLVQVMERHEPEVVHHLAAQVDVRRSVADPMHDAEVNVLGTIAVLEAARRTGVRKVVYASSVGSYGEPRPDELPVDETYDRPATSPYGTSKRVAMDYLATYEELYGVAFTALTLANVYGPHQTTAGEGGVVSTFIGRMLQQQPCAIYGDGEQTRDFVFVDDVVHAFVLAMDRADGQRLMVGTGERTSINQLFRALAAATGYAARADPRAGPPR